MKSSGEPTNRLGSECSLCCVAFLCLIFFFQAGCDSGPKTYVVSGTVSYQGKSVTGGLINFKPTKGKIIGGGINSDGTFEFRLPAEQYQVRIDTPPALPPGWKEGDPAPTLGKREVPLSYARFASSGLTATVEATSEPQQLDFSLD